MAKGGVMGGDLYNSFGAMHGTIMVFLAIVPVLFGAFGNYVTPLQIGAPDMAFPRLNMASFHCYFLGGVVMFASFFTPGGAARSGWTSYSPLASITDPTNLFDGQTYWLMGMVLLITSSLLGSVNFIATIIQLRCRGMSWMRMPFFVWAQFVTGFLLLLAFPPLEAAGLMQLMDNLFGSSFFLPQGLVVGGTPLQVSGGGSPLLWQHLFWFLGHPEVYVLILPAIGIVAEVISNNIRKPLWGYKSMVYAAMSIGFLSFIVWAHHMYLTGMGTKVATFFQTTTMMISIPSVIILTALFISLWGGSIRFNSASLAITSAHEAMPGHWLHSVHMRQTPGKIRRIWIGLNPFPQPSSGQDGWAHYAEELVVEQGFMNSDPRYELAQLSDALTRICRLLSGIRLHTGEWTLAQAQACFEQQAYVAAPAAKREAERGTYDPTYGGYFLGKRGMLTLRRDVKAAQGDQFNLRDFHERVMKNGIAPIWAHRQLLLPGDTSRVIQ
jgi:hypothetical protein